MFAPLGRTTTISVSLPRQGSGSQWGSLSLPQKWAAVSSWA